MERALHLWDRPPIRYAFVALAVAVLAAGIVVRYDEVHHSARSYQGPSPDPYTATPADYGHRIPLPAQVDGIARRFIRSAVLRTDPGASYSLVTPEFRAGHTRASWATGDIPVQPFPRDAFGGARDHVVRSRQRSVLLLVAIGSTKPSVNGGEFFLELVPRHGRWLVSYWAPKGTQPPVPSNQ
jgi:hypothetical protein